MSSQAQKKMPHGKKVTLSDIDLGSLASEINDMIGPDLLNTVSIEQKTPVGAHVFVGMDPNGNNIEYRILVYNSTERSYKDLMVCLPEIMSGAEAGIKSYEELRDYAETVTTFFFRGKGIPPADGKDIYQVLLYYYKHHKAPKFYPFGIEMRQNLIAEFSNDDAYKHSAMRLCDVLRQVQEKKENIARLCNIRNSVKHLGCNDDVWYKSVVDNEVVEKAVSSFCEWIEEQERKETVVEFPCEKVKAADIGKCVWVDKDNVYLPNDKFDDAFRAQVQNMHSEQLKYLLYSEGVLVYNDDEGGYEFCISLQQGTEIVFSAKMFVLNRTRIWQV